MTPVEAVTLDMCTNPFGNGKHGDLSGYEKGSLLNIPQGVEEIALTASGSVTFAVGPSGTFVAQTYAVVKSGTPNVYEFGISAATDNGTSSGAYATRYGSKCPQSDLIASITTPGDSTTPYILASGLKCWTTESDLNTSGYLTSGQTTMQMTTGRTANDYFAISDPKSQIPARVGMTVRYSNLDDAIPATVYPDGWSDARRKPYIFGQGFAPGNSVLLKCIFHVRVLLNAFVSPVYTITRPVPMQSVLVKQMIYDAPYYTVGHSFLDILKGVKKVFTIGEGVTQRIYDTAEYVGNELKS
jgi:hypothetical protein